MRDFRKLKVWQKAHQLTLGAYKATATFPKSEAPRPEGGASGRCKDDYRVGFLPAYKAGHPTDLPVRFMELQAKSGARLCLSPPTLRKVVAEMEMQSLPVSSK